MPISNLSNGLRTGVCTSTNRPTTPYEGQVIYETDTDLSYVWGGTAWQQISGGTAVGNSGLVYISTVTLSAAAGTAAQWSGTVFSSTYTNYRLVCNLTRTGGGDTVAMQLGIGTTATATGYYGGGFLISTTGVAAVSPNNISNGSNWPRAFGRFSTVSGCVIDITNPNVANITGIVSHSTAGTTVDDNVGQFMGYQSSSTQFTSFALISTATSCAGTIAVYGYRNP